MPNLTGYGYQDETEQIDNPTEEAMDMPSDTMNAQSYGPSQGRTGADVIVGAMNQPDVCKCNMSGAGTTGKQADMSYGSDAGYGA